MNTISHSLGKVGVLMGGISAERDISLMSGSGVLGALQEIGVDAHGFDTGLHSLTELAAQKFDRVFIALHGRYGEDGCIQGALEILGIPYTGSDVMASSVAMNKELTKRVWQHAGLLTPRYHVLSARSNWSQIATDLGLPLIIKPAHEGSTIGLTKISAVDQMAAAYQKAAQNDRVVIAEQFIDGIELTCPILGEGDQAFALPVIRINAPEGNYDYQNKYFTDTTEYLCPSGLSPEDEKTVQNLVTASYRVLNCRGWARADVMLCRHTQQKYLLEINTSPGMTSHSLVPMSARQYGWSYAQLCVYLLEQAQCLKAKNSG